MAQEKEQPRVVEAELVEAVPSGVALIKAENSQMASIARLNPRDERTVLKKVMAEINLAPELAGSKFYSIPYKDRDPETGEEKTVYVEGPSIKLALQILRRYGNAAAEVRRMDEDDDKINLVAVFLDYETNVRIAKSYTVSKWFKKRNGQTIRLDAQRLTSHIQANASKALRNVILDSVPEEMVHVAYKEVRKLADKKSKKEVTADPKKWAEDTAKAFLALKVPEAALISYLGHPLEKSTPEEVSKLRGIYNAIKDGHTTAMEVFAPEPGSNDGPEPAPTTGEAGQQVKDLFGGEAR